MFNDLIESRRKHDRTAGQMVVSVIVHAAIIAFLVYATANAGQRMREKEKAEELHFVEVKQEKPPEPKPEQPPPPDVTVAPPPPKGFQTLTPPIDIPDKIPDVDLSKAVTDEADFSGKGVAGGVARGVEGGTGPVNPNQTYFDFQVEKVAGAKPGNPAPHFPDVLRSGGMGGEVMIQVAVDTSGRADMSTFQVLKTSNELLTREVKKVLPAWRFFPAEIGGRKVRMYVRIPFNFNLTN
ncbi:MAG TPA: energy transducer TonB [Gemmatimonadaceae bacterium]|nr:energy transducer TonB [Gemmatimonadaceae bacterium]